MDLGLLWKKINQSGNGNHQLALSHTSLIRPALHSPGATANQLLFFSLYI